MFVESDGKSERAKTAEQSPKPATPHPSSPHPGENLSVKMSLNAREILPCQLKQRWGEMYTEGTSLPRKFSLEMAPLIPGSHSNRIAYMIFEMSATGEATAEGVEVDLFQGMLSPNLRPMGVEEVTRAAVNCLQKHLKAAQMDCGKPKQHKYPLGMQNGAGQQGVRIAQGAEPPTLCEICLQDVQQKGEWNGS